MGWAMRFVVSMALAAKVNATPVDIVSPLTGCENEMAHLSYIRIGNHRK